MGSRLAFVVNRKIEAKRRTCLRFRRIAIVNLARMNNDEQTKRQSLIDSGRGAAMMMGQIIAQYAELSAAQEATTPKRPSAW